MYESACLMYTVYGREVSTDVSSYLQMCSLPDERMSTPEAIAVYKGIRWKCCATGARLVLAEEDALIASQARVLGEQLKV